MTVESSLGPQAVREAARNGRWTGSTAGAAPGYAQANLIVVRADWANEFRDFCRRNPAPCPLLDVTEPGSPHPKRVAPNADLRTDVAGYRVYEAGQVRNVADLSRVWRDDLVSFLIGCSYSFERAFRAAGIVVRHAERGTVVPMFLTNRACDPAGRIHGRLVVSMRPVAASRVAEAHAICARFPGAHGEPVHAGDPAELGIADIGSPDYGDPVPILGGEEPVFWACGVTPQAALVESGCEWFASHEPGHMFVTDREETIAPLDPPVRSTPP